MKHQQVTVDYYTMFKTSIVYLLLTFLGYLFFKLMRIMYYLPAMLKDQQKQFEELADKYDIKLDNKDIGDIKTDSSEDLLETLKMDEKETDELSKFDKEK
ncbi:uncharacterized protein LOC119634941 [Glossina fuscipes]|uniref:Uncharacterized protein LOC119634941 n=1 Tax=Glossina fuscipes TaxID=7396 RepID=A0A8U0WJ42_9MUSC|nr:uncharacterized protein LOC119634941 [Glossina fuscipes]